MSQNNRHTLYAGLDVAKQTLALDFQGQSVELPNDAKGHRRLLRLLGQESTVHVVLEATEEEEGSREAGGRASRRLRAAGGARAARRGPGL